MTGQIEIARNGCDLRHNYCGRIIRLSYSGNLARLEVKEKTILLIRQQKVMLDADLAELYGVETKILVRAAKRNIDRFPTDFMFQLSKEEFDWAFIISWAR